MVICATPESHWQAANSKQKSRADGSVVKNRATEISSHSDNSFSRIGRNTIESSLQVLTSSANISHSTVLADYSCQRLSGIEMQIKDAIPKVALEDGCAEKSS